MGFAVLDLNFLLYLQSHGSIRNEQFWRFELNDVGEKCKVVDFLLSVTDQLGRMWTNVVRLLLDTQYMSGL